MNYSFLRKSFVGLLVALSFLSLSAYGSSSDQERLQRSLSIIRKKLKAKLVTTWGEKRKVVIGYPNDSSGAKHAESVSKALQTAFESYGDYESKTGKIDLEALTLENLRKVLIQQKADVLIMTYIKAQSLTIYLYDRVAPYFVYAAIEGLPKEAREMFADEMEGFGRLLLRKALFNYVEDEYFTLPRDETPPVLKAQIPDWMVSSGATLARLNEERGGRFAIGFSMGSMLLKGAYTPSFWNTNGLSAQLGLRLFGKMYLEANYTAFTYHLIGGMLRFQFSDPNNPLLLTAGLGFSYLSNRMTLNADETHAFSQGTKFLIASLGTAFPIVDCHFRIDASAAYSLGRPGWIFSLMPGVVAYF